MMATSCALLAVVAFVGGYLSGRRAEREGLYRRFWHEPARTMDTLRSEARQRYL